MADECIFNIRKAEFTDAESVKEIEVECGLSSWTLSDYRKETERGDSIFYVCEIENKPAGFILARLITNKHLNHKNSEQIGGTENLPSLKETAESEIEIYNIGVKKNCRRISLGSALFQRLYREALQNKVKKIWLEVRISNNGAINFYGSKGFEIIRTRKNLYTEPFEDGFIMCLNI